MLDLQPLGDSAILRMVYLFRRDSEMLVNCTTWGVRAQQELKLHIFKNQLALHLFIQLGHQLRLPWTEVGQKMPRFIF